jgi:hypothetical protein
MHSPLDAPCMPLVHPWESSGGAPPAERARPNARSTQMQPDAPPLAYRRRSTIGAAAAAEIVTVRPRRSALLPELVRPRAACVRCVWIYRHAIFRGLGCKTSIVCKTSISFQDSGSKKLQARRGPL